MARFYFTYGTEKTFPFYGGWTIVEAENEDKARAAFSCYHYDNEHHLLNCAGVYSENEFKQTKMYEKNSNLGAGLHETIRLEMIKE